VEFPQTFAEDRFRRNHPAFIWAFRATRNWPELKKLIPGMKDHLGSNEPARRYYTGNGFRTDDGAELDIDFDLVFKELFCVAAQEISEQIHQPLDKMGVLFEDVMTTGTHTSRALLQKFNPFQSNMVVTESSDPENGDIPYLFKKGQFFFLVRQLSKQEEASFAATGFRFAAIEKIAFILSRSMQVTNDEIFGRLEQMRVYSAGEKMMEPGVYIVCFSLHPTIRNGCDVLVLKDATNLLPFVSPPIDNIVQWQLDILSHMNEWTVVSCLRWLKANSGSTSSQDSLFCQQMHEAISKLADMIEDPTFDQAKFSCRRIMVPCRPTTKPYTPGKCTVFSFRIITIMSTRPTSPRLSLAPLCFFRAQQQVYAGVADHQNFLRDLHREFAHCAELRNENGASSASYLSGTPPRSSPAGRNWGRQRRSHSKNSSTVINPGLGGIMVSNRVTVDASVYQRDESRLERQDLGISTEASFAGDCNKPFVDELCALCNST
jgi:hypothetical protein